MKNLYIDFDGVILDTLPPVYNLAKKLNIDYKTQTKEVGLLFSKIDWEELISESPELSDSTNNIKKLKESKKFNITILTHVNSLKEAKAKIEFINNLFNDLTIIPVPKACSKTMMTQTKGAILVDDFSGNLKEWQESGGIAVKFVREKENGKYPEITSLEELLDMKF
jgi:hypothetical protein